MENRIIVIDDEKDFLDTIKRGLVMAGYRNLVTVNDPVEASRLFEQGQQFDLALIDITMPGMKGTRLLKHIKQHSPGTECIMITALDEARQAVDCIKAGAYDYLVKPILRDELYLALDRALERRRLMQVIEIKTGGQVPDLVDKGAFSGIVTQSPKVLNVLKESELHAASNVPVLITGDSGTGKELLARSIHRASRRSKFPYSAINMVSLSSSLFDAEFFGHTKGAFTGAEKERKGYLETTHKGTLFLDEIGHLPVLMHK